MKIMVTGGAGFIGSNVVDGLLAEGHEVVVVDDLSSGKRSNLNPAATFYEMDVRSPEIETVMARERPHLLNHHAAQISVPASVADPALDADINIQGLLNLLESGIKAQIRKVIFISSGGAIYGEAEEVPTSEGYIPRPLSPYAVSKFASEHYLNFYGHHYGLDFTVLRYANIYGPRQIPHGEAGVVAIFMDNLLKGTRSTLFHFPGEEAGMVRDYCFVGDVVAANIKAISRGSGEIVNVGTGSGTQTLHLYQTILKAYTESGAAVTEELSTLAAEPARPGDLSRSCLRVDKARQELDWVPRTDLVSGIRKTLSWRMSQEG